MLRKIGPVLALALAAACGSDGDKKSEGENNEPDASLDGSAPTKADATVNNNGEDADVNGNPDGGLEDGSTGGDASPLDGSQPDAGQPDAAFTLTVRAGSKALADIPVVLHDATGALVGAELKTNASGQIVATTVPAGVTLFAPGESGITQRVVTLTKLAAGDNPVVELPSTTVEYIPGKYSITLKRPPGNATEVRVYAGRGGCAQGDGLVPESGNVAVELTWPVGCAQGATNSLLAVSLRRQGQAVEVQRFVYEKGIAPLAGATVAVDVSAKDWALPVAVAGKVNNHLSTALGFATLVPWAGGVPFTAAASLLGEDRWNVGVTTRDIEFEAPAGFAEAYSLVAAGIETATAHYWGVAQAQPATNNPLTVDFAKRLPAVQNFAATSTAGRPKISWAINGTSEADVSVVTSYWGAADARTQWIITAPGADTSIESPVLPDNRKAFIDLDVSVYVSHYGNSAQDGYRGFLSEAIRTAGSDDEGPFPLRRETPASGLLQSASNGPFQ